MNEDLSEVIYIHYRNVAKQRGDVLCV